MQYMQLICIIVQEIIYLTQVYEEEGCKFRNRFTSFLSFFAKNVEKKVNMLYDEGGEEKKI